jgi:2-polyprenyl-3-methyl-5-hydroxy-6-metoxy-1,4-benzoquinol methylase
MSRFESTVPFYSLYRKPYPPEFFAEVARRLRFQGMGRLLDAACGPAPLAIGFAPFPASSVGVDSEPERVASALLAASQADISLELLTSRLEDVPRSIGLFHIVTIGRALHWLERDTALPCNCASLLCRL